MFHVGAKQPDGRAGRPVASGNFQIEFQAPGPVRIETSNIEVTIGSLRVRLFFVAKPYVANNVRFESCSLAPTVQHAGITIEGQQGVAVAEGRTNSIAASMFARRYASIVLPLRIVILTLF